MSNGKENATANPFEDCSAERVFSDISAQVDSAEIRTLWLRLQTELTRQGPSGAITYLTAEFTKLKGELDRELSGAKSR